MFKTGKGARWQRICRGREIFCKSMCRRNAYADCNILKKPIHFLASLISRTVRVRSILSLLALRTASRPALQTSVCIVLSEVELMCFGRGEDLEEHQLVRIILSSGLV